MTEGTPLTNSVYQKLFAIMQDLKGIEKTGFNQNQKYKFVSSEYLLSVVREHFIAHGLVFVPSMLTSHMQDAEKGRVTTVEMNFRVVDTETGDYIDCPWMGHGWDTTDKGIYKAATGATKYFLMKLLMLGEPGDDAEFDGGQQPRDGGREQKKNPFGNAPTQKAPAGGEEDPWRPSDGIPKPIGAGDTDAPPLVLHPMDMEGTTRSIQKRADYYAGLYGTDDADEEELEPLFAAVAGIMPELAEDWQKQGEMLQDVTRHIWGDWALTVGRTKSLVFHLLEVTADGDLARDKEDNLVLREYAPEVLRELYLSAVSEG